ncbi:efflux RND transporter periplasmic adaptor subunit [Crassaminicella thermophila]|nr:efflux RND transporter periplasmic adaptor subunit [Crassaminicella thermophila]
MKKKIIIVIIIVVISIMVYMGNDAKTIEAEIFTVKRGDISAYVDEMAIVKSRNQRVVYAKGTNEMKEINVEVGDLIKKGDLLAKSDTKEIDIQIKGLEAKLKSLLAAFEEAIKPADKEKINQMKAKVTSAKVNLEEAKRNAENYKKLYEKGAVSFDTYKRTLKELSLKEQSLKIAENELALLEKGVSNHIKKQYEGQIEELKYQIDLLKKNREDKMIKAPVDGVVLEIYSKEGQYMQPGTKILEIGDVDKLYLETDILVSEIGNIQEGMPVMIYSDDLNFQGKGYVSKIHPKAFSKSSDLGIEQKRVKVEIDFTENNVDLSKLKVGYEVDVKIILWTKQDVLFVPDRSIFTYKDGNYVFAIENNTAILKKVKVGVEGEDRTEIVSGLNEGEKIVLSPYKDLEEGIKIKEKVQ